MKSEPIVRAVQWIESDGVAQPLLPGTLIVVEYGAHLGEGTQLARVLEQGRQGQLDRVAVVKWLASSRRWTGRRVIPLREVKRLADNKRIEEARRHGAFVE